MQAEYLGARDLLVGVICVGKLLVQFQHFRIPLKYNGTMYRSNFLGFNANISPFHRLFVGKYTVVDVPVPPPNFRTLNKKSSSPREH